MPATPAKLVISPEVEQDLGAAYTWYEERRAGLGEEFMSCVDACVQGISRIPEAPPIVHQNYRRGLVRRFPYAVYYEYAAGVVTVYGVFHTARDPEKWRERLLAIDEKGRL